MILKKLFFSLIIILFFSSVSFADIQTFGNFSAEVPEGWSGELENSKLIIKNKNKNASMEVEFNQIGDDSFTDIVERLYIQMDGRDLEQDDDGDYNFNFVNSSGVESIALIADGGGYYLLVLMSGFEDENLQADFEKILDSIDWKD